MSLKTRLFFFNLKAHLCFQCILHNLFSKIKYELKTHTHKNRNKIITINFN